MKDTAALRARLEAELLRITKELEAIAVYDRKTDNWEAVPPPGEMGEADENVEADVAESWGERRSTLAALEIEYRNHKRALKKLADGSYGICEVSGHEIEVDRLDANPAARTCLAHKDEEGSLPL
jgi:RNA polymerase-binding transcription factor DksA